MVTDTIFFFSFALRPTGFSTYRYSTLLLQFNHVPARIDRVTFGTTLYVPLLDTQRTVYAVLVHSSGQPQVRIFRPLFALKTKLYRSYGASFSRDKIRGKLLDKIQQFGGVNVARPTRFFSPTIRFFHDRPASIFFAYASRVIF